MLIKNVQHLKDIIPTVIEKFKLVELFGENNYDYFRRIAKSGDFSNLYTEIYSETRSRGIGLEDLEGIDAFRHFRNTYSPKKDG